MILQGVQRRMDVPTGRVPDYRTFVRHLWTFDDPDGFSISPPPVMYSVVFDESDEDWCRLRHLFEKSIGGTALQKGVAWVPTQDEFGVSWEIRFRTLRAVHAFCVLLGALAADGEPSAVVIGEFVMWTLGFRWV